MAKPKIAVIGLGKLGFPVAVTMGQSHDVIGYDVNPTLLTWKRDTTEKGPRGEKIEQWIPSAKLSFAGSMKGAIDAADIIFVAIQTPHDPRFEGITTLPDERKNFQYSHLIAGMNMIKEFLTPTKTVVLISTVLPGTLKRHILPIIPDLVYNPFFIAMGTVMRDFIFSEFVLLGSNNKFKMNVVWNFYDDIFNHWDIAPRNVIAMGIESAELTKVAYNTFIGMKIAYANTVMEICHKTEADVDEVMGAIGQAGQRLISRAYLTGGMGDGGACHPRDNIAMSWLARNLGLSYDIFDAIMKQREGQAEWLADLMIRHPLPKVILGKAFKAETNITTGSHSLLVAQVLVNRGTPPIVWDPLIDEPRDFNPSVFLIGTKHLYFKSMKFPSGSVVIDPHRYIDQQEGINVIQLGKH